MNCCCKKKPVSGLSDEEKRPQKRITDEYMGPDWFPYSDVRDYKHIADSFDNAMKIGMEGLRNLSGGNP